MLKINKHETIDGIKQEIINLINVFLYTLEFNKTSRYNELLECVHEYVTSNLKEDLSLERIADELQISSSHLRKIFKEETGITLKSYITEVRMDTIKTLLIETKMTISDISLRAGYVSAQSFARAFKKAFGVTPTEFRNINQKDDDIKSK